MAKRVSKTKTASLPTWFTGTSLHILVSFLLGFLLYANTLWNDYAQDDAIVIYDNEFTVQGIEGIGDLLKYDTFRGFFKVEGKDKLVTGGRYRPLTPVMFALEVEVFGQQPWIGHFNNALFYGLTGVLLYLFMVRLLRDENSKTFILWMALVTTLLFLVHPVHTEAVANIKGRDEVLVVLLGLVAFLFAFKSYDTGRVLWSILAGLFFFLALLSKENAIMLVAVLPLGFYYFRKTDLVKIVLHSLPLVVAAGVFLYIRGTVLGWDLGEPSRELMNNPFLKLAGNEWVDFSSSEHLATVFHTLGRYLQLLFFPHPLTHDYYPRHIEIMSFSDVSVIFSFLAYLGLLALAIWGLLKKELFTFGIWFFLITLFIVSNLVVNIGTNMSERFVYLPSLGFCFAIAALLYKLAGRKKKKVQFADLKPYLWGVLIVSTIFAVRTVVRNFDWKDNYTLFTTDIAVSKNSAKLNNSAGAEIINDAIKMENEARRKARLQEGVQHLKKAIEIHPTYKNAYLLLGNAHNYLQEYEASIQYFQHALRLDPNYEDAKTNLAMTYRDAGRYFGEQKGDLDKSRNYLLKAYETLPDDYETNRLLGVLNGIQGNAPAAISYFSKALEVAPESVKADAHLNLGNAYYNAGDQQQGQYHHSQAEQIQPGILQERLGGG